ncbi:MAG: cation:proton antiporter [Planctomycetota bacterium]|nr:cation:proton antiporter [Planctomycetota bacterium]
MNVAFLEPFLYVAMGVLMLGSLLCLYRIGRGPTAPDRTVAIDILGTLMVGFCCVTALWPHNVDAEGIPNFQDYFMTIAIAWALTSFIGTLALAKYLEGRCYDA